MYDRDAKFLCHARKIEIIIVVATAVDNTVHSIVGKRRGHFKKEIYDRRRLSDVDSAISVTPRHWLYYVKDEVTRYDITYGNIRLGHKLITTD